MSQDRENSLKTYSYLLNLVGELTYIYLKNTDMYAIIILEDFWNGSDCLPYTGWWWFRLPPITGWWWFRLPPLHRLVVVPIASPTPVGGSSDCPPSPVGGGFGCLPYTGRWRSQLFHFLSALDGTACQQVIDFCRFVRSTFLIYRPSNHLCLFWATRRIKWVES